jgi:glucose/arabinose dehydrogenase
VQVIFRALPTYDGDKHFGSSLAFDRPGRLFITLGERSDAPMRPQAQDLGSHMGKTIRSTPTDSVPSDNPFVGRRRPARDLVAGSPQRAGRGNRPQRRRLDHRARHARRRRDQPRSAGRQLRLAGHRLWHRIPRAADQRRVTAREGLEQPVYYWDPVIARAA